MKKGFTLIEMLGVLIIISLLIALVTPNVINYIKNGNDKKDEMVLELIYNAANTYIKENRDWFQKEAGNNYCISLQELEGVEGLSADTLTQFSEQDILDLKSVQVKYTDNYSFELVNNSDCIEDNPYRHLLKNGYQRVEYIESTGNQYIDTLYKHRSNTKIKAEVSVKNNPASDYNAILGARNGGWYSNAYVFFYKFLGTTDIPVYNRTGNETRGEGFILDDKIKLKIDGSKATWSNKINSGEITTTGTLDSGANTMFIFNINTGGVNGKATDISWAIMKLYSFKIYEGNLLIKNYIPAYNISSGNVGLYEMKEDQFYTSPNGNIFFKGKDLNY